MHEERGEDGDGEDVDDVDEGLPGQDPQVVEVADVGLNVIRLLELEAELVAKAPRILEQYNK